MSIKIVVVGKTREVFLKSLQRPYLEHLARYTKVQLVAVREHKLPKGQKAPQVLGDEAKRILEEIREGNFCVVLDSQGKEMTSPELANFLQQHLLSAGGEWCS